MRSRRQLKRSGRRTIFRDRCVCRASFCRQGLGPSTVNRSQRHRVIYQRDSARRQNGDGDQAR